MSLIPIILNVLLAVLLVAALLVGWRLERRLKELRQSHVSFAKAVQELDVAALRAQAGLDQLRLAADEAGDLLTDRLVRAREVTEKLQGMIATAQKLNEERQPLPPPPLRVRARSQADTLDLSPDDRVPVAPSPRRRMPLMEMDDDLFSGPDSADTDLNPDPNPTPKSTQSRRNLFGGRR
ncbi:MAG: hypothetical protein RLZZ141_14 [Pseudomonadota bacterium]|jgi:hypothetical protein